MSIQYSESTTSLLREYAPDIKFKSIVNDRNEVDVENARQIKGHHKTFGNELPSHSGLIHSTLLLIEKLDSLPDNSVRKEHLAKQLEPLIKLLGDYIKSSQEHLISKKMLSIFIFPDSNFLKAAFFIAFPLLLLPLFPPLLVVLLVGISSITADLFVNSETTGKAKALICSTSFLESELKKYEVVDLEISRRDQKNILENKSEVVSQYTMFSSRSANNDSSAMVEENSANKARTLGSRL